MRWTIFSAILLAGIAMVVRGEPAGGVDGQMDVPKANANTQTDLPANDPSDAVGALKDAQPDGSADAQAEAPKGVRADVRADTQGNGQAGAQGDVRVKVKADRDDSNRHDRHAHDGRNDSNRWRYKWHNGHWWYWLPNNSWVIRYQDRWVPYSNDTYYSFYPRGWNSPYRHGVGYRGYDRYYDDRYYDGRYNDGRYYRDGYYGNRNGGRYYHSREGRTGAQIGGAIGGNRGAAIGGAIGDIIDD